MKSKSIYANIPSFLRGDDGNPNFRAGFKSNAKQYEWSGVDVVFVSTESVFFCRHSLSASITEKRMEDNEKEECFLFYFWRWIGNVLSAVNSVFSLLLNVLSCLEGECGSPLLCATWPLDVGQCVGDGAQGMAHPHRSLDTQFCAGRGVKENLLSLCAVTSGPKL